MDDVVASTRSPDGLRHVAAVVHDWWFHVDDVVIDKRSVVTLRLAPFVKALRDGAGPFRTLRIRGVLQAIVEDSQHVGIYDVEELIYDERARRLVLSGGVPVTVSFVVAGLDADVIGDVG